MNFLYNFIAPLHERMQQHAITMAMVAFNFLLVITLLIANLNFRVLKQNQQNEMHVLVNSVETKVRQIFAQSELTAMTLAKGIVDSDTVPDFNSIAAGILESSPYFDAVQMVPNGVISQVYPYEAHKSVIGYDILNDKKVNKEAFEAIRTKRMMFAGPINLKQGGVGVIGRLPVYRNGKFWGFSVVIIMLDRLVDNLGIENQEGSRYFYQLGKLDPNTGEEMFFLNPPVDVRNTTAYDLTVFPESGWKIYVMSADSDWMWTSTLGVIFIGITFSLFVSLLVRSFLESGRKLAVINQKLEWQHREMRDSILGASYLQQSVLQTKEDVKALFGESFVLYRPKDAVSGDFFWCYQYQNKKIVAAVDCTGHGVSAALLSMVANQLLHQTIILEGIRDPSAVLERLNKLVTSILQSKGEVTSMDGMDMIICSVDSEEKEVVFAGANRPLYMVRSGLLEEFPGNRFPIGGHQLENRVKSFDEYKLPFSGEDIIYLTSDGYHSQFGGPLGKKLGRRRFRDILSETCEKPIDEQRQFLEKTLSDWGGKNELVDDILIIGIKC